MSSAGISFGGLASGLDTKSIIAALMAVEQRPIDALGVKKTSYTKQKSLFGDLSGLLDKLTTASKALKQTTDFLQNKAASSDETVLTASASPSATPGSYTVSVEKLARAQVGWSDGRPSGAGFGANPSLIVNVGGQDHLISIASNNASLDEIASAINSYDDQNSIGVRADVVNTGDATNPYQLIVRSTKTGQDGNFTLSVDEGDASFTSLVGELGQASNTTAAQDAELKINGGITIHRASNQISDLFAGITLDLKSAKPGTDLTVTISTDAEATSKKVQDFVDAYNKVVDFFTTVNAVDSSGAAQSPLFGDPTVRSLRSSLRSVVGGVVDGTGNDAYQLLSQVGIKSDKDGKLTFDSTKFSDALNTDKDAVAAVFTQSTNGIAGRLADQINVYTDSVNGLLKSRSDSFDRLVKDTQDRIDQGNRRLTQYQQQLETKYANLESLLSQLQSQGNSLSSLK